MSVGWAFVFACLLSACLAQERRQLGFLGVRGKKDGTDEEFKRAPTLGFQGLRGKKEDVSDYDVEEYKRAPPMGFQGVRGKKGPTMGFVGMRGKKDGWDYLQEEEKRAPASGFFGMRGKKAPASGFFGMRGKKGPSNAGFFGMRGKKGPSGFLGLRGKKDTPDDIDSLLQFLTESRREMEDAMDSREKRLAGMMDPFEDYQMLNEPDLL
ncbi:tachykinins [Cimex lectularius]|uniref:Tachykinin n=1 Tax=Cimex lectularius TaxID=79782 RepID=A0A8I6TD31_CIMLE|nr:tachykinins [Cimex lectularius]